MTLACNLKKIKNNYIIYYIIWAELEHVSFYTYLIPALIFQSPQI